MRYTERYRYEFVLEARTAIAQAEGTVGNHSLAMMRKIRLPTGQVVRVPIVPADAMRHQLREAAVYALLDGAGLMDTERPALTESAVRLLLNGGMLTGRGDPSAIKLDEFRALTALLPTLPLFGGCCNNHLVSGQLEVGDALLWCEETASLAEPWQTEWLAAQRSCLVSGRALLDEEQRVRFDPTHRREVRQLLSPEAADRVTRQLAASERAHDENNAVAREASKSTVLPRTREVIAQGSLFLWTVEVTAYTPLELDAFHTAMAAFLARARVGGGSNTRHGHLRPLVGNRIAIARPREAAEAVDLTALAPRMGEAFRAHCREHADALRAALARVDA